MQHQPVTSSFITHVAHDPETQTLEVTFKNGSRERYDNVSVEDHQAFVGAESLGRVWNQTYKGKGVKVPVVPA